MNSHQGRTAGWVLALLIGLGISTVTLIGAAKAADDLSAAEEVQATVASVACPSPTGCQPPVPGSSFDPPLSATSISGNCRECGTALLGSHAFVAPPSSRPTFLDRVSYQTTGPPHVE